MRRERRGTCASHARKTLQGDGEIAFGASWTAFLCCRHFSLPLIISPHLHRQSRDTTRCVTAKGPITTLDHSPTCKPPLTRVTPPLLSTMRRRAPSASQRHQKTIRLLLAHIRYDPMYKYS
ncbi:unnamed protein product [Pleuronectes platessa]|uniref:Uncharacterized protein n=1 Tax=Pleuronectes platessa TaxID=8262 RepID=A0A9N7USM6_PLEPL|nr:unnamed protein product [Pleuronectes platessa]